MLENCKKYGLLTLIFILIFVNFLIFKLDFQSSNHELIFAMLNIGQGDAIFIQSPTGTQIMFDGGPIHKVLGPLSQIMPFYDKSLDAIIVTNPDADHIGGFLDILKKYKVGAIFEPGTSNVSKTYQNLENEIKRQKIKDVLVKKGMRLDIGGGAYIDILFPDRNVSLWSTNDGSIVARLVYGNTSVMLTGDATKMTEQIVMAENSYPKLKSTILKVGHHGSHTSTSVEFVKEVAPAYALVSNGKNNKYGHPHKETLDTLNNFGTKIFRTDLLGTIILNSDGKNFMIQ